MSNNVARCAAGFKSMDRLPDTLAIGGAMPVKPGAAAVLIPKSAKKRTASPNHVSSETGAVQVESSFSKIESSAASSRAQADFDPSAPGRTGQISLEPSIFKQAAAKIVIEHIQALTASAKQTSGQTKSLLLFTQVI